MVSTRWILVCLACGVSLAAGDAAGSVTAAKGLHMNGQAVPVAGTKSWPVGTGDELKSEAAPVVLTMSDGSRIMLGAHSRAKVEAGVVRLLTGTMRYELAQRSTLQVAVQGDVLPARAGVASTTPNVAAPAAIPAQTPKTAALAPVSRRQP